MNLKEKLQEEMKHRKSVINGKEALKDHNDETVKIDSTKGYQNFDTYFIHFYFSFSFRKIMFFV